MKESHSPNIKLISVTLDTFHLLSGWLKEFAPANICLIYLTYTFQLCKSGDLELKLKFH